MNLAGDLRQEVSALHRWAGEDFGVAGEELATLCFGGTAPRPLYFSHLPIALSCAEIDSISEEDTENLAAAYVFLTAAYFSLDALLDDHKHVSVTTRAGAGGLAASLPLLLSASLERFSRVFARQRPAGVTWLTRKFRDTLVENSRATEEEAIFSKNALAPYDESHEHFHMWARSNSAILLFEVAHALARTPMPDVIRTALMSTLAALQFGDDIGDWQQDFRAKKWTPFLRECFATRREVPPLSRLEEIVYLEGQFERQWGRVIHALQAAGASLPDATRFQPLRSFIEWHSERAKHNLNDFIREKIAMGVRYNLR